MAMRDDVGDRLPVDGQDNALARLDCVDDLARVVSQVADADLHVLHRSTSHHVFARRGSGRGATRTRASSTVAPVAITRTGLRSTSAISGTCSSRSAKRRTTSRSAGRSSGTPPRVPSSHARTPAEASKRPSTSTSVSGASANATSPASPAWRPPMPTPTAGPRPGSATAPTRTSAPASTSGWTITPPQSRRGAGARPRAEEAAGARVDERLDDPAAPVAAGGGDAPLELLAPGADGGAALEPEQDRVDVAGAQRRREVRPQRDRAPEPLGGR